MPEQIRVGVIGTSWWADLMHLPSLRSHPRAELAAICGRNRERAQEMARQYEIPLVFTDYREMIEKANLHAVVVSTPDDLHYPMTMEALDAGLHVLCEKPLALTAGQAREMYEKAEAVGVKHMTFFTFRWLPNYRGLHQLIAGGSLGRSFHSHLRYLSGYGRNGQYAWRFDRSRANGVLGDLGSHMIDLARWLLADDIAGVSAQLATLIDRPGVNRRPLDPANDSAVLAIQFVKGAQGIIQVSAVAHVADRVKEQHIVLHGESGTLEVELAFSSDGGIRSARSEQDQFETLPLPDELWEGADRTQPLFLQAIDLFRKQPIGDRLFINAIVEDQPVSPSFYDGLKAQEVIEAALESDRKGCRVSLL